MQPSKQVQRKFRLLFGQIQVSGSEIRVCCPFCPERLDIDPDIGFHLWINPGLNAVHCFRCHYKGSVYRTLRARGMVNFQGLDIGEDSQVEASPVLYPALKFPEGYRPFFPKPSSKMGIKAWEYITSRGVTEEQLQEHRIGYAIKGFYQLRIILPVLSRDELVYWTARSFLPAKIRYLNPCKEDCPRGKSEVVFNLDIAAETGKLIITEGYMDALAIGRSGVAILGSDLSTTQMVLIRETGVKDITVCLDGEAWENTLTIAEKLVSMGLKPKVIRLPCEFDPADLRKAFGNTRLEEFLDSRVQMFSWVLKMKAKILGIQRSVKNCLRKSV